MYCSYWNCFQLSVLNELHNECNKQTVCERYTINTHRMYGTTGSTFWTCSGMSSISGVRGSTGSEVTAVLTSVRTGADNSRWLSFVNINWDGSMRTVAGTSPSNIHQICIIWPSLIFNKSTPLLNDNDLAESTQLSQTESQSQHIDSQICIFEVLQVNASWPNTSMLIYYRQI